MFSPVLTDSFRAARRALDLARAALLLEPVLEELREPAEMRPAHVHRTPLRARRARRRGGAVAARPQHCIAPLPRATPRDHEHTRRH